ncbi:prolyl oligopeptidase family serine peptidase [Methylobacterium sp. WL120]|uniref:alpha/beta hydrolase family protein n=1 Tax=Methylobacterium sp. WL120 TaxID=2603887 RepID=UPI0011C71259|nr:prolyl oligopeptidase family serine peptidase [Methylobacterium sp. WL120]TXM69776.1 prolyl oligopeptidase family serine peptidase [Methylobacterium sp. WL120]
MRTRWLAGVGLALGLGIAGASAQGLGTEAIRIPMDAAGPESLDALVMTPGTPGRHPLALISHGSPRSAADRPGMSPRGMLSQMTAYARRGFVAAAVMRGGYGTSSGGWAEGFGPCDDADYLKAGRAGAADLWAAIASLARRPNVDPARILAVGRSAGGFATVALTESPPPGLVAAISFAGGRGSQQADRVCSESVLIDTVRTFGSRSQVPMLWVYAEYDRFFRPDLAARLVAAFREGGGTARFVAAPAYGSDGHGLFSQGGQPIWEPIVDAFLAAHGLPTAEDAPARDGAALEPPPRVGVGGSKDFETYRAAASHKAFAVSAGGAYAWRTAQGTKAAAIEAALQRCELSAGGKPCRLYAVDDAYTAE